MPCGHQGVSSDELDTTTELASHASVKALFVAGTEDKITPVADIKQLHQLAAQGSELIVIPDATHETVTYYMADLAPPVLAWLSEESGPGN